MRMNFDPDCQLIQRVNPPVQGTSPLIKLGMKLGFGGGGSGFLPDVEQELVKIMSFDYMGRAEFEFGALPKCMMNIAESKKRYGAYAVKIATGKETDPTEHTLYLFVRREMLADYIRYLNDLANTFSYAGLKRALLGEAKTVAWIDLRNEAWFSTDLEMTQALLKFLKIKRFGKVKFEPLEVE